MAALASASAKPWEPLFLGVVARGTLQTIRYVHLSFLSSVLWLVLILTYLVRLQAPCQHWAYWQLLGVFLPLSMVRVLTFTAPFLGGFFHFIIMGNPFQVRTHRQYRAYKAGKWARYYWLKGQHYKRSHIRCFGYS